MFGAGYGSRFNQGSHQCLHWCQQYATGILHLDGFDSRAIYETKKAPGWVLSLFGAGYGSRTRLLALGRPHNTDIPIPRWVYYSREEIEIQVLFVDSMSA